MAKTKKIDRDFLLTDSSVNCYGFRLLTSGYLIDEYKKNAIGYHMHDRSEGVVVKWEDMRIDGDSVYGKPVINLSNKRGQQTVDEVQDGFLNGASVGHIVALEWSEEPAMMLPGQTGPTITKWYNRECSLCDVPGNMNALALYDKEGHVINLADFKTKTSIINMKQIILTAAQLALLQLKDDSEATVVDTTIKDLAAKAAKVDTLTTQLAAVTTEKDKAVKDLADFKKVTVTKEVNDLVDAAVTATQCTKEAGEQFKALFAEKPTELKALLATMKPYQSITGELSAGAADNSVEVSELIKLSGEDLFKQGKFDRLKELSAAHFKVKYKEYFGTEPK